MYYLHKPNLIEKIFLKRNKRNIINIIKTYLDSISLIELSQVLDYEGDFYESDCLDYREPPEDTYQLLIYIDCISGRIISDRDSSPLINLIKSYLKQLPYIRKKNINKATIEYIGMIELSEMENIIKMEIQKYYY